MAYPAVVQAAVDLQTEVNDILDEKQAAIPGWNMSADGWRALLAERAQVLAERYRVSAAEVLSVRAHLMVCRRFARNVL